MGKKSRYEPGMKILDQSLETIFCVKIHKFFDADPGFDIFLTLDPGSGMKKIGSGIGINIRNTVN
jgi:hypothetical protein